MQFYGIKNQHVNRRALSADGECHHKMSPVAQKFMLRYTDV